MFPAFDLDGADRDPAQPLATVVKVRTLCISLARFAYILSRCSRIRVCVERLDTRKAALFLSSTMRLRARLVPRWKPAWFDASPKCYNYDPNIYLNLGTYGPFGIIQSSTIALAYPDESYIYMYMHEYGKYVETPIPRAR